MNSSELQRLLRTSNSEDEDALRRIHSAIERRLGIRRTELDLLIKNGDVRVEARSVRERDPWDTPFHGVAQMELTIHLNTQEAFDFLSLLPAPPLSWENL